MIRYTFCFILILQAGLLAGEVKLPRLISDGAVLQRNVELKLWGWASAGEKIELSFRDKKFSTQTNSSGEWMIKLPPQPAGGPFTLVFSGTNKVAVNNVLFGDVWVCSGQSNMELTMERVKEKYSKVIETAANDHIRQFLVADKYDFNKEHNDLDAGNWVAATPAAVLDFSAVAYFFACELYQKYKVPVGLINAALGGSPAEAWMSEDALVPFPDYYRELQRFKNDKLIAEIETHDRSTSAKWYNELNTKDVGTGKWNKPEWNDSQWNKVNLPGYWADDQSGEQNGSVWFRKKIEIPASMAGKPGRLWLGRIVDSDSVFINGKFTGTTGYQYPPRRYSFGADVLKPGENIITVRVISNAGRGSFVPDKPYYIAVGADTIDLKGEWRFSIGAAMPPLPGQTIVRWKPAGLFNRMIAPLLNCSIKGVIWYQGESNVRNPMEYEKLFPTLIHNWRERWKQGDFPFLYVQLANFLEAKPNPTESSWAALRQAQLKTLSVNNTAMAVAIDLGEWNDIHPLNKADVGKRLAIAAQKIAYNEPNVIGGGPLYQSHEVKGNKIIIQFKQTGGGLVTKGDALKYFAIAGADKKFVWAQATIEGNKVVVWGEQVDKPVAVRYAWADNPEGANLYNKEGLPASPFSTEDQIQSK
ncbi:MAG: sialate O-acetylesterase [Cyclobacteriaceae bacterium]|nr:sialate O-acetylesterase [Cyclobacteriaceae bacterium]